MTKPGVALLSCRIPAALHRRAKQRALDDNIPLQGVVEAALERYLAVGSSSNASAPATPMEPARERSQLTVPERVAAAMGDGVWDVSNLAQVLADSGDQSFRSNKPRAYVSAILSEARTRVSRPDGTSVCKADGTVLEVRRFVEVKKGRTYRVATEEEIQLEARKVLGSGAANALVTAQTREAP